MPVSEWRNCNIARVPSHAVMTNSRNDRTALWNFLNEAQVSKYRQINLYNFDSSKLSQVVYMVIIYILQQRFGPSSNDFKIFDSSDYTGSNLLFKDSTIALVEAGDKDTYKKWLGNDYYNAVKAINCERTTSSSAKVLFSPVVFILMAVTALIF